MLKYVNKGVVFQEIPDETTLALNISNCPCHCKGCHSPYLTEDIGTEITEQVLTDVMNDYRQYITCLCFMGGDADTEEVNRMAKYIRQNFPEIKVGWYSGRDVLSKNIQLQNFDYIKIGSYQEALGGLRSPHTNQRMYRVVEGRLEDLTPRFWPQ